MNLDIESLKESVDFLNDLYDNVTTAIFLADDQARIRHFNDAFRALFQGAEGGTLGELCGNAIGCCFPVDEGKDCGETSKCGACALRADVVRSLTEKVPVYKDRLSRDFVIAGKRLRKHLCFSTKYRVYRGIEYVLVLVDDVSQLEEARLELEEKHAALSRRNLRLEQVLRAEAAELMERARDLERMGLERDELAREIRHRVGNNLQVISSLLSLSRGEKDEEEDALSLRTRIGAVIEVYRHAVYEAGTARVRARDLLRSILASFYGSDAPEKAEASLRVEIEAVDFDFAIPLGLILGEFLVGCSEGRGASPPSASLALFLGRAGGRGLLSLESRSAAGSLDPAWGNAPLPEGRLGFAELLASTAGGSVSMERSRAGDELLTFAAFYFRA